MLSTIERMLFLRNVRFFENLRLDQLRTLSQICEELSINEGEYILRKGEAGDKLFIIVEGDIHIIDPDIPKENSLLSMRGPGDVIGEISLFDGGLRTADGLAMTPALVLLVPREALDTALVMLGAMAEHVRETNKSIMQLSVALNVRDVIDEV
jgi:CRP-like cAMP-binding protein